MFFSWYLGLSCLCHAGAPRKQDFKSSRFVFRIFLIEKLFKVTLFCNVALRFFVPLPGPEAKKKKRSRIEIFLLDSVGRNIVQRSCVFQLCCQVFRALARPEAQEKQDFKCSRCLFCIFFVEKLRDGAVFFNVALRFFVPLPTRKRKKNKTSRVRDFLLRFFFGRKNKLRDKK